MLTGLSVPQEGAEQPGQLAGKPTGQGVPALVGQVPHGLDDLVFGAEGVQVPLYPGVPAVLRETWGTREGGGNVSGRSRNPRLRAASCPALWGLQTVLTAVKGVGWARCGRGLPASSRRLELALN